MNCMSLKAVLFSLVITAGAAPGIAERSSSGDEGLPRAQQNTEQRSSRQEAEPTDRSQADPVEIVKRASDVLGMKAVDESGNVMGRVSDMLMNVSAGYTTYLVFRFDEYAELSGKLYPIPVETLPLDPETNSFTIDVSTRKNLENAPAIAGDRMPDSMGALYVYNAFDVYWGALDTHSYGRAQVAVPEKRVPFYVTLNSGMRILPGATVSFSQVHEHVIQDQGGKSIGTLTDLMIDMNTGRIPYLFATFERGGASVGRIYPIPLSSFTLDYPGDRILFDLDTGSLDNAFGFPRDRWPNLISLYHDRAVSSYWIEASPEIWFRPSMRIIPGLTERLSGMMNLKVTNQQGESLGEIKDYVITTDGRVPYTAIDFGGLFDLSGRWYFAPTGSMTVDLLNTLAFFNIDRESLKEVPKFDSDKVPNTKNPNWDADILLFWKHLLNPKTTLEYVGPWEQMKTNNSNALLFSRLMGYQVDGSNRKPLGEVDDLLLDIGNAGVRYIAVSSGGLLDLGERMTLVPFSHVQLLIGTRRLLLDVEPDAFRNAPGFKPTGWPDTSKPGWNSEIDRYWKDR